MTADAPVREIRRLNTLRGIAVLIVLVSHYANETGFHPSLGAGGGQFGVMLFFLLSGFLMAYLYFDLPSNRTNLRNYFVARMARVVPLYYAVVLVSFLLMRFAPPPQNLALYGIAGVPELASHLFFLHGISVLWTIPPEIQFYLLFGIIWAARRNLRIWLLVLSAAILLADFFLGFPSATYSLDGISMGSDLLRALPYFVFGGVFGHGYRHWTVPAVLRSHFWILALAVIPLLYPLIFAWLTGHQHGMWSDAWVLATMSAIFYVIVFLVPDGNVLLENPLGDFLGKISYSVYLFHVPVLAQFKRYAWVGDGTAFLAYLAAILAVASLTYACFEVPSRKFLRGLFGARARTPTATVRAVQDELLP